MSSHSIVKTGLGIGLMAASLGASAQLHSFSQPMFFTKSTGTATNYVAFIPSINGPAAGLIYMEMLQSGSVSTWAYGLGGAVSAAGGGALWSVSASKSTNSDNAQSFTAHSLDVLGVASGVNWGSTSTGASQNFSTSWYGGDTASISMSFAQVQTVSSQACGVSFVASIGTDDYLLFTNFTIQPTNWMASLSASDSVSYRTKSGTTASDTLSIGSAAWNAANFSATSAFPTFAAFSVPAAGAGAQTIAMSVITKANLCTAGYTAKAALNAAGSTIGARAGMMRLW